MTRYPFYFINDTCPDCGKTKSIVKVNKYGKITKDDLYPLDHFHCINCNKDFSIEWLQENNMYNVPVVSDEYTISEMISNIIDYANKKRRKV